MDYKAVLLIRVGEDTVPVTPCKIDSDGGVFVIHESDRNSGKKTVTWHRIATISQEHFEGVE